MCDVRSLFPGLDGVNGPTRQLLLSASNYLSASAFLLRKPGVEESELRLIERASALIDEATSIMTAIKQSSADQGGASSYASLRALVEKASGWLITPSGSRVALDLEIGASAGFISCEVDRLAQAFEALFAKACIALDQARERRIAVTTRRKGNAIEIEICYAAPALQDALRQAMPDRRPGDLPAGPAVPEYRKIIRDHGGTLTTDYDAAGRMRLRLSLPAADQANLIVNAP